MSLSRKQRDFVKAIGKLINFAYDNGYELTFGDTYPGKYKHIKGSFHERGLAVDLNLFKDGKYMRETLDHKPLGLFWESLGGTWGGRFRDGNHYSWGE
jgi:hypothetical protein